MGRRMYLDTALGTRRPRAVQHSRGQSPRQSVEPLLLGDQDELPVYIRFRSISRDETLNEPSRRIQ